MARVPTSAGNQIALAPMGQRRIETQDAYGGIAAIGQGIGNLAAATMDYAQQQDALQAQLDEAAAKQLDTDYAEYSREVLHTGENAFYTMEGFNAANAREEIERQLEERRAALLARAANPRQRAMLEDALERRFGADVQGVATYANGQLRVEQTRQSARRATVAADDAVTYYDDPIRFAEEIAVGSSELRTELARQGAAPETIQDEVARWQSSVYRRVGEGMLGRMEIDAALAYVADNSGAMTETDRAALDRAIAIPLAERRIDGLADFVMGEGRPIEETAPAGEAGAEGDEAAEPDLATRVGEALGDEAPDPDQQARGFALPLPVDGRQTSGYGRRRAPTAGASTNHRGIDIAAPRGTPIRAQAAGRVISARDEGAAGNVVRVDYGNGVEAIYAHMDGFNVSEGDSVTPGQVLGPVGSTGTSTGPHVHYGLKVNGEYVDPATFVGVTGRPSAGNRTSTVVTGLTLEEANARIESLNLPLEEERALRQEVANRFSRDEAIVRDRQETARDAALEILNRSEAGGAPVTRASAIPGWVWDAMAPDDAMSIRAAIEANAAPAPVETDMNVYLRLSDTYASDPAAFARLNPADYVNSLSRADFEQIFGTWRRDAIQGVTGGGATPAQVSHSRINGVMAPAMAAAGLSLTGIPTGETEARQAMARRIYAARRAVQAEIAAWQAANPGREISDDRIREITDRQLTMTRARSDEGEDGWFSDTPPRFVPWFERGSLGTTEYVIQVPASQRERLRRLGREALGRTPTDLEIGRAWQLELRQ